MPKTNNKISYEEVHELFNYDKATGIFTNKIKRVYALKDKVVGHLSEKGYWRIEVKRKSYFAHRLAWLYVYGYFPEHQVDHINQIKTDNRIENLREVTNSCNLRNSKVQSRNISGITGVHRYKGGNRWQVYIQDKEHKTVYIGFFTSKLEAAKARYAAELKYNYPDCNTQSSALVYINSNGGNSGNSNT